MSTILEALKRSQAMRDATGGNGNAQPRSAIRFGSGRGAQLRLLVIAVTVAVIFAVLVWLLFTGSHDVTTGERIGSVESTSNPAATSSSQEDQGSTQVAQVRSQDAAPASGFTTEPDAGERIRQLTEQASNRRSDEPTSSEQSSGTTQWDTGPAEPRDQVRTPRDEPTATPAEQPPSREHRLPENTIEWREFVRNYPRRPPELRLTVHRFHSDPSKRMAMINMRRYAPGDRIDRDVVLREIVAQGVVVRIGEQNVLLETGR